MKVIVETKIELGSGAETRILPCKGDVKTELRNCLINAARHEEVILIRDDFDDEIESYNNNIATVENDKALFAYDYTIYNWVICEMDIHETLVIEGGTVHSVYSSFPLTCDILNLDTNDGDLRTKYRSTIASLEKNGYEIYKRKGGINL